MMEYEWINDFEIKNHINKHIVRKKAKNEREEWGKTRINNIDRLVSEYEHTRDKLKTNLSNEYIKQSKSVLSEEHIIYVCSTHKGTYSANFESQKDKLTTCVKHITHSDNKIVSSFFKTKEYITCGYWLIIFNSLINARSTKDFDDKLLRLRGFNTNDLSYVLDLVQEAVDLDNTDINYYFFLLGVLKNTFQNQAEHFNKTKNENKELFCNIIFKSINNILEPFDEYKISNDETNILIKQSIEDFLKCSEICDTEDHEEYLFEEAEFGFLLLALYFGLADIEAYKKEISDLQIKYKQFSYYIFASNLVDEIAKIVDIIENDDY